MTSSETVAAFEDASPEVLRAANRRITTIHGHLQHAERQDDVLRRPCSSQTRECVVIGGSVLDVQARPLAECLQTGTSVPGAIELARPPSSSAAPPPVPGGVGRNIAQTLAQLGHPPLFLSAVGKDTGGDALVESIRAVGIPLEGVRSCGGVRTGMVSAVFARSGEIAACVADCGIAEAEIDAAWISRFDSQVVGSRLVIVDANLSPDTLVAASKAAAAGRVSVWFEPVSVAKAGRFVRLAAGLDFVSPNAGELVAMAQAIRGGGGGGPGQGPAALEPGGGNGGAQGTSVLPALDFSSPEEAVRSLFRDCSTLLSAGVRCIVLTLGGLGVIVAQQGSGRETPSGEVSYTHLAAPPAKVVSTCGAGDSLVAGAAAALLEGAGVEAAVAFGMAVAHRVVQFRENAPRGGWDRVQLMAQARGIEATARRIAV